MLAVRVRYVFLLPLGPTRSNFLCVYKRALAHKGYKEPVDALICVLDAKVIAHRNLFECNGKALMVLLDLLHAQIVADFNRKEAFGDAFMDLLRLLPLIYRFVLCPLGIL